ncbi:uncharacterized protein LOC126081573 [Elephas maximus indicus]|uniref:uncharacterized protein LOC126081573 n=1 Tax=Elephas maximus indicus TaxID=99487 RepID=UPI002116974D|nr:uncharacterized protein LOC126081573 [Elephas maximus indicus]
MFFFTVLFIKELLPPVLDIAKRLPCESLALSPWPSHNGSVCSAVSSAQAARSGASQKGRTELRFAPAPSPQSRASQGPATPRPRLGAGAEASLGHAEVRSYRRAETIRTTHQLSGGRDLTVNRGRSGSRSEAPAPRGARARKRRAPSRRQTLPPPRSPVQRHLPAPGSAPLLLPPPQRFTTSQARPQLPPSSPALRVRCQEALLCLLLESLKTLRVKDHGEGNVQMTGITNCQIGTLRVDFEGRGLQDLKGCLGPLITPNKKKTKLKTKTNQSPVQAHPHRT